MCVWWLCIRMALDTLTYDELVEYAQTAEQLYAGLFAKVVIGHLTKDYSELDKWCANRVSLEFVERPRCEILELRKPQ